MEKTLRKGFRTWIEIDTKALENNYRVLRSLIPKTTKFCAVVKSNAYGHGLFDFAKKIDEMGADSLAVDSITEATRLRKEGIHKPLLVLGYTLPERVLEAAEGDISLAVSQFEALHALEGLSFPKPLKIHLKVDTGMHRQGFLIEDAPRVISLLKKFGGAIVLEGLFTHFAIADEPANGYTNDQLKAFDEWKKILADEGFTPMTHAAASAGIIAFPQSHFDMVRAGAALYGIWPSRFVKNAFLENVALRPVLSWKTIVSELKHLKAGERIGYGLSEELSRDSRVAVCPIGYWHGYPRSLSSIGEVLIKGKRAKIIGRVSMDMITVDVTDVPEIAVGDEVTLIGQDGDERITAFELAEKCGTINYEIVTRLNPLIKKIYI